MVEEFHSAVKKPTELVSMVTRARSSQVNNDPKPEHETTLRYFFEVPQ